MESAEGPQDTVSKPPSEGPAVPDAVQAALVTHAGLNCSCVCVWRLRVLCPAVSVHMGVGDKVLFSCEFPSFICSVSGVLAKLGGDSSEIVHKQLPLWPSVAPQSGSQAGNGHFRGVPKRGERGPWLLGEQRGSPSCLPRTSSPNTLGPHHTPKFIKRKLTVPAPKGNTHLSPWRRRLSIFLLKSERLPC